MKKIIVALGICLLLLVVGVQAQTAADIKFKETKHVFGKIEQGKPQTYIFTFKNNSKAKPLIIENATAECGCTTPDYPKMPVAKGKSGKVSVTYNAASPGAFSKKVTVKFAKVAEPIILVIEGDVIEKKGATPASSKE